MVKLITRLLAIVSLGIMGNSQAKMPQMLNFQLWINHLPTEKFFGVTLFEHPAFQAEIVRLMPEGWDKMLEKLGQNNWGHKYNFVKPIEQVEDWLVIIGQGHYWGWARPDMAIFINITTQKI